MSQRGGSMTRYRLRAAMLFTALLSIAAKCFAQEVRATLSGTVTDSSGSAVPNAQVRLTSVDKANAWRRNLQVGHEAKNWEWARMAVWDVAGNGAFVNPVRR